MDEKILETYALAAKLKQVSRAGWKQCGVGECESVAEHSFGVAMLALLAADASVDREKCVTMALVHDLAEAIVGDLTPRDGIDAEEKTRREREALQQIGDERLLRLWEEFEAAKTPEAKLVRDLDQIEMAWQAKAYALEPASAAGFIESARRRIQTPAGRKLLDKICP